MNEREQILAKVLNCNRTDLYADPKPLLDDHKAQLENIYARRQNHEPLQYILGNCDFMGLEFFVDQRVFVPRPETELLVEEILRHMQQAQHPLRILDIGTGSGNIIITLAKKYPQHQYVALDISGQALEVACANAKHHSVFDKIRFTQFDFLNDAASLTRCSEAFDIIVSNPPYIAVRDLSFLPPDVQKEPRLALDGGEDGLNFYRVIARDSAALLTQHGYLFLEIGDGQSHAVQEIFTVTQHWAVKKNLNDYTQTPRIMIMERKNNG